MAGGYPKLELQHCLDTWRHPKKSPHDKTALHFLMFFIFLTLFSRGFSRKNDIPERSFQTNTRIPQNCALSWQKRGYMRRNEINSKFVKTASNSVRFCAAFIFLASSVHSPFTSFHVPLISLSFFHFPFIFLSFPVISLLFHISIVKTAGKQR